MSAKTVVYTYGERTCNVCEKKYTARSIRQKYCKRECTELAKGRSKRRKEYYEKYREEKKYLNRLENPIVCNESFPLFKSNIKYSIIKGQLKVKESKDIIQSLKVKDIYKRYKVTLLKPITCLECGVKYSTLSHYYNKTYCCKEHAHKACKRKNRVKRKLLKRKVQVEPINPLVVFNRDNYHCKMCGVYTPLYKRGLNVKDSPELDHIIPLSKGGKHSYTNTQTLCRLCNAKKGDVIITNYTPRGILTFNRC